MKWNDTEFYTSHFMVELIEGIPFFDSPLGLYGAFTSFDSPAFQDTEVKKFIQEFEPIQNTIGLEVDQATGVIQSLPGIFLFPAMGISQTKALEIVNRYVPQCYTPVHEDFRAIGFFPSRDGTPVREVSQGGITYTNGVEDGLEVISTPTGWVESLVKEATKYCDAKYSHHKDSKHGSLNKAYVHATKIY